MTCELTGVLPRAKLAAVVSMEEVLARVRETANWDGGSKPTVVADAISLTAYAPANDRERDPYGGFEPRIVPENVTLLPKTTAQANGGNAWNERTIVLKKGDSVSANLHEMGATPEEVKAITTAFGGRGRDSSPKDGYKLRVLVAPTADGRRLRPVRVVIATDTSVEAMVAWSDKGKYVAVDVRSANTVASSSDEDEDDGKGVRLYQSIYETALRNHIPRPVVDDLIRIYSYDVDFQRKVQPGDSFEVLFASDDENANDNSKAEVLYALLTTGGEDSESSTAIRPPTTISSTTMTRAAKARRNSWCANLSQTARSLRGLAAATIRSSGLPKCIPAWTGPPPPERRSLPPATASSRRRDTRAGMENTFASATRMGGKPPMGTCPRSRAGWKWARRCARAR